MSELHDIPLYADGGRSFPQFSYPTVISLLCPSTLLSPAPYPLAPYPSAPFSPRPKLSWQNYNDLSILKFHIAEHFLPWYVALKKANLKAMGMSNIFSMEVNKEDKNEGG